MPVMAEPDINIYVDGTELSVLFLLILIMAELHMPRNPRWKHIRVWAGIQSHIFHLRAAQATVVRTHHQAEAHTKGWYT